MFNLSSRPVLVRSLAVASLAMIAGSAAAQTVIRGPIYRPNSDSRYYVVQSAGAGDWTQFRNFARTMGGDLATINDANEQAFVLASVMTTNEKCFIGLSDAATEGTFVWSDGSNATYRNFAPSSGNSNNRDYVLLVGSNGIWDIQNETFTPLAIVEVTGPVRLPGEVTTFAQAVTVANAGPREILLGPGTFTPNQGQDLNFDITIRGSGVGVTTLQSVVGSFTTLDLLANVVVENMTIDQRASSPLFDFDADNLRLLVRNCEVTSAVGLDSGELVRMESSIVTFESSLIHDIDAATEGWLGTSQVRYINCVIRDVDTISRRDTAFETVLSTFVNCTITRVTGTLSSVAADNTFYNTVVLSEPNIYAPAQLVNTVFTDTNPGFVNPTANNFNLQPTSSLIDSGSTSSFMLLAPTDFVDFAGNPRGNDVASVLNTGSGALALDIGAYEFQGQIGCDDIDFNNNGVFPEEQDVIDFFTVLAGGNCSQ